MSVALGSSGSTILAVRVQGRAEGRILEPPALPAVVTIQVGGLLQRMALETALLRLEASYIISGLSLFRSLSGQG